MTICKSYGMAEAGCSYTRFDEREGVPSKPRRGSLLYSIIYCNFFLVAGLLSLLAIVGCASQLNSPIAANRIDAINKIIQEESGPYVASASYSLIESIIREDRFANVYSMITQDPDPVVRMKAFEAIIKIPIVPRATHSTSEKNIHYKRGMHNEIFYENTFSLISSVKCEEQRFKMWHVLSDIIGRKEITSWAFSGLINDMRKECCYVLWKDQEDQLLSYFLYSEYMFLDRLRIVGSETVYEKLLSKYCGRIGTYPYYDRYLNVAKEYAKLNSKAYAEYEIRNCKNWRSVLVAIRVLSDEKLITDIVLHAFSILKNNSDGLSDVTREYCKKIRTDEFLLLALKNGISTIDNVDCFLNSIKDENTLTKALCDTEITKRVDVFSAKKYLGRIKDMANKIAIANSGTKFSLLALEQVTDQEYLLSCAKEGEESRSAIALKRLDRDHRCQYEEYENKKKMTLWHEKFDPLIEKANAGDFNAMRAVANDAWIRDDIKTALGWYIKLSDADFADANESERIGDIYYYGEDGKIDVKSALKYYLIAAQRGSRKARFKAAVADLRMSRPELNKAELSECANPNNKPDNLHYYVYYGGTGIEHLKILQALPTSGGVLVHAALDPGYEQYSLKKNILYLSTDDDYVDDEPLKAGVYIYTGRYTYTTAAGATKSVRSFKQWVPNSRE